MNKSRLIYLLVMAALVAYFLACFSPLLHGVTGMSDGGGL